MYKISIQSYYGILIHKRLFLNNNSHYGYLCNKSFYYKGGDISTHQSTLYPFTKEINP